RIGGGLDVFDRRAHPDESGERIGLDVVKIDVAGGHAPVFGAATSAAQAGGGGHLALRSVVAVERPQFEQRRVGKAAGGVGGGGGCGALGAVGPACFTNRAHARY